MSRTTRTYRHGQPADWAWKGEHEDREGASRRPRSEMDMSAEELIAEHKRKSKPQALRRMKMDLKDFWANFVPCGPGENQCLGKCRSKEFKLKLLKEYAEKEYFFHRRIPLAERRTQFRQAKRLRRKFRWPCFVCGGTAEARHHIIELRHGATNAKRNVIPICHKCHADIHPWLVDKTLRTPRRR